MTGRDKTGIATISLPAVLTKLRLDPDIFFGSSITIQIGMLHNPTHLYIYLYPDRMYNLNLSPLCCLSAVQFLPANQKADNELLY